MSQSYYNQFGQFRTYPPSGYRTASLLWGATRCLSARCNFPVGTGPSPSAGAQVPGMLPVEQSYIENILRLNKGKLVTVYATFENNTEWNAKIFKGHH